MAKKSLCIIGGILMFFSVFLPVLFFTMTFEGYGFSASSSVYYWMWGYAYSVATVSGGGMSSSAAHGGSIGVDRIGVICMIIIIIGAILALVMSSSSSKGALVGGLLGMFGMIIYYIIILAGGLGLSHLGDFGATMIPFIGFYVCLIGGLLTIIGGASK